MGHVHGADDVRIEMLGHVRVVFEDREIIESDWLSRRAQELVALLALADGHRLARDEVIEQLWPHLGAEAGAANLRQGSPPCPAGVDDPAAIVLRSGRVELFPSARDDRRRATS